MAKEKKFYLTEEGLEKIKKECQVLKNLRHSRVSGEVPKFLESEDINPEYLAFQEDLSFLETKIADLEFILKNSALIKPPSKEKSNIIDMGATVLIDINGEIDEFTIVGTLEADPVKRKISNESPLGRALMGKRVGETAMAASSIINHSCKIIKIKYNKI